MRTIKRSALVPYLPEQMFALVADFQRYPEFLPWVAGAEFAQQTVTEVTGTLHITYAGIRESVTTRNTMRVPEHLQMQLIEGPFRALVGDWYFAAVKDDKGVPCGTRIELCMQFEFKNPMRALLLSRAFESSCTTLVDAFVQRARVVYGNNNCS